MLERHQSLTYLEMHIQVGVLFLLSVHTQFVSLSNTPKYDPRSGITL